MSIILLIICVGVLLLWYRVGLIEKYVIKYIWSDDFVMPFDIHRHMSYGQILDLTKWRYKDFYPLLEG